MSIHRILSMNYIIWMKLMSHTSLKTIALTLTILVSACATGTPTGSYNGNNEYVKADKPLPTKSIDNSTEKLLAQAEAEGNSQQILAVLKDIHTQNPNDPIVATRYGRALREDDQVNAASRILEPFTKGNKINDEALTEMAMTQLALGKFQAAENYGQKAVSLNEKNGRAYLALGTALDAQKQHQAAEVAFRKGLKNWNGDSTPILNNLALNLASQGHLEEALSLIEKAQEMAPGRMDLERNRRIIATLLETTGGRS